MSVSDGEEFIFGHESNVNLDKRVVVFDIHGLGAQFEVGYEAKQQIDHYVEKGRNAYREHRQEKRAEKKAQKVDEALKRYDSEFETSAYLTQKQT